MNDGFLRVAAVTTQVRVCDVEYNEERIKEAIRQQWREGTKIAVFPELAVTGYTCHDMFFQKLLLEESKRALLHLVDFSKGKDMLTFIGLPWEHEGKLYNVTAGVANGQLLGLITKIFLPNYSEFYEARYFARGFEKPVDTDFFGEKVPLGSNILFRCTNVEGLMVAGEICEDVWVANPPSISHALHGATVLINSSASDEQAGKESYRRLLITGQSARLVSAYIYANAGEGESTQDVVFGGHNLICENGVVLAESRRFKNQSIVSDIDLEKLLAERKRQTTFEECFSSDYRIVDFSLRSMEYSLKRGFPPLPFVPQENAEGNRRLEEILTIQAMGLKKRLSHTKSKRAVLGISGGLDSTLALLVCERAFQMLGQDPAGILGVTMPGFGTTDRTYQNACALTKALGASLEEIPIGDAILQHFKDIGQDVNNHDATYENAQARERTQILMDIANRDQGLVVGTGDLSELALGWATYNGDQMSMYGVNASVPKTLVRHLVKFYGEHTENQEAARIILDIVDTPVSPELLPPREGEIAQITEDLVGPYELHDFFIYYMLRFGFRPFKIHRMAKQAFQGQYTGAEIKKWMGVFYKRFFSQQFKRSCMPDGPKVGSITLSPRGDLRMPSDALATLWLGEVEEIHD